MIFYVPNNNGINRFIEQISLTTDTQSSLTKNVDVAGSQGATKSINSKDLTSKKTVKTVEILNGRKYRQYKNYLHICVNSYTFCVGYGNCILDIKQINRKKKISVNICHVVMISGFNRCPYISLLACRITLTGKLVSSFIILFYSCVSVGNKQSLSVFSATINSRWL